MDDNLKALKNNFLDLIYKHHYALPANTIKNLIVKFDKAKTLQKKEQIYNMVLEFEKLGVATMKDLKNIKKFMKSDIKPEYEKEYNSIDKNKKIEELTEQISTVAKKGNQVREQIKKLFFNKRELEPNSTKYNANMKRTDTLKKKYTDLVEQYKQIEQIMKRYK